MGNKKGGAEVPSTRTRTQTLLWFPPCRGGGHRSLDVVGRLLLRVSPSQDERKGVEQNNVA
jgi:hypothetical protein